MRKLTLNEKISIKGLLANKGVEGVPMLDMCAALHYWRMCFGKGINQYYKLPLRYKRATQ